MELPKSTDIELQLTLLRAIVLCSDSTAAADELRPVVAKALSLIIPEDQKDEWTNLISWALIDMRDRSKWLTSPWYEKGTQESPLERRKWIKNNRPGQNQNQQIWKISEEGEKILREGYTPPPEDGKKIKSNRTKGSDRLGKIKHDEAGQIMYKYFQENKSNFSGSDDKILRESRELIIKSIINGVSAEVAFSRALKILH